MEYYRYMYDVRLLSCGTFYNLKVDKELNLSIGTIIMCNNKLVR